MTAPGNSPRLAACLVALALSACAQAQKYYTYVGPVDTGSALLAWGTTEGGGNTIGRHSKPQGKALVKLGGREVTSDNNWVSVGGLEPDREYSWEVFFGPRKIGEGTIRTHPVRARTLAFFVIGDYGNGSGAQRRIAEVMLREWEKRSQTDNPVRFVLTTGDNIYASRFLGFIPYNTGDRDEHWESKFFAPYERLTRHIPFYPTLGNHDGNESESRQDLEVYLDNFFFPGAEPARYYKFSVGGLAEFFALDTTRISLSGPPVPLLGPKSEQFRWLKESLAAARAPWNIAYFHHPPFTAGPNHEASLGDLRHVVDLLGASGVQAVFNGHEHNLQFSKRNRETGGVLYVITGAGGELRSGSVTSRMEAANIAGWAPQHHFLLVEIEERIMRITPLGYEPIRVTDKDGRPVTMPVEIRRE